MPPNHNLLCLLLVSLFVIGCGETIEKRYSNAITAGRSTVPIVKQFHTLFGPSVHDSILYFDGSSGETKWSSDSILAQRYHINVQIPITVSTDGRAVSAKGDATFLLVEITQVEREGSAVKSRFGKTQEHFGPSEWELLVKSGGDFGALGMKLDLGSPVPNINLLEPYYGSPASE